MLSHKRNSFVFHGEQYAFSLHTDSTPQPGLPGIIRTPTDGLDGRSAYQRRGYCSSLLKTPSTENGNILTFLATAFPIFHVLHDSESTKLNFVAARPLVLLWLLVLVGSILRLQDAQKTTEQEISSLEARKIIFHPKKSF